MTPIQQLSQAWLEAKAAEQDATERRRQYEDELAELIGLSQAADGTTTKDAGGYSIKVTQRLTRSVDSDLVQSLAAEAGLTAHLGDLFRWKPELNKKQWDHAAESIRSALAPAITEKPGRPSFSITKTEQE